MLEKGLLLNVWSLGAGLVVVWTWAEVAAGAKPYKKVLASPMGQLILLLWVQAEQAVQAHMPQHQQQAVQAPHPVLVTFICLAAEAAAPDTTTHILMQGNKVRMVEMLEAIVRYGAAIGAAVKHLATADMQAEAQVITETGHILLAAVAAQQDTVMVVVELG